MLKLTYLVKLVFPYSSVQITHVELLDHIVVLFLIFFGSSVCFPQWLHQFTFQPRVHKGSFSPRSCEHLSFLVFLMTAILPGVWWHLMVLICVSLMISDVEHLYMCLLSGKCLFKPAHFLIGLFGFFLLSCMSSSYTLDFNALLNKWFANIFSRSIGCLFICWWLPLLCRKVWCSLLV